MNPDDLNGEIAAIARHAMIVARSRINVAVGNTLVLPIPLAGIELPDGIAGLLRSVADSTGFTTSYSAGNLLLSWTNVGSTIPKSTNTTLADIYEVLKEIKDMQIRGAQKDSRWSRQDVMTVVSLLLAFVLAILGQIEFFANEPGSTTSHGSATVQTHTSPASDPVDIQPHPSPRPNDTP
jgi:hypothetical protein